MKQAIRLVIVTGMSGAGKTQAIKFLEDMGFFCVDNLPPALMPKMAELSLQSEGKLSRLALGIDIRGGAHRTPDRMLEYAQTAGKRGIKVIIAGAGGAAHLPGMVASSTTVPVIGVPILSSNSIDGWDSILSILQMPSGIPVATVALNGALNAGLLAARILSSFDTQLRERLVSYQSRLEAKVLKSVEVLKESYPNGFD